MTIQAPAIVLNAKAASVPKVPRGTWKFGALPLDAATVFVPTALNHWENPKIVPVVVNAGGGWVAGNVGMKVAVNVSGSPLASVVVYL